MAAFLPALSEADIAHAAQLIQQANDPTSQASPEQQRSLQQQLFDVQKRPEAWGLVLPFMESTNPYIQFFGAHTAQVKIARDWEVFPHEYDLQLRDLMLELMGRAIGAGRDRFVVRKLFVATTALALRLASLVASDASHWADWVQNCVTVMGNQGASRIYILEFLEIAAQEVGRADLLGPAKARMRQTLLDVVPSVITFISDVTQKAVAERMSTSTIARVTLDELTQALKCQEAWLPTFPTSELDGLLPGLFSLLDSSISVTSSGYHGTVEEVFVIASDALQDILTNSALSSGSGTKVLTEPLLLWCAVWGDPIIEETRTTGSADGASHSFCKLLVALGDHSTQYIANNLSSTKIVSPAQYLLHTFNSGSKPRGALVQTFLRLLLAYTSLPGHFGVDEEESDLTLGFWYLFQEALWNIDLDEDEEEQTAPGRIIVPSSSTTDLEVNEQQQMNIAKAVYAEAVRILRRKVVWPDRVALRSWSKDAKDKFKVYRRDVGDALINAYYVLREDMMNYFLSEISERLPNAMNGVGWEEIEGTLHCILSIQEAIPVEKSADATNAQFATLFGAQVLGRLPTSGQERIRLTMLYVIGEYSSWFTTLDKGASSSIIMNAISYTVPALRERQLCLAAANALRDLCDQNRTALAPHIGAFAELHASIATIPDAEKSKVLQSISSVIQALPPQESIAPTEALIRPVIHTLQQILQNGSQDLDTARAAINQQLQTLTGVAKGLTKANDSFLALDLDDDVETSVAAETMNRVRQDPQLIRLREELLACVREIFKSWSLDASISDTLSDFLKAITSLPADMTIISLPAAPLLELVCVASQRQLTAVWLALAGVLVVQLNPPPLVPTTLVEQPDEEASRIVSSLLPVLLQTCLSVLSQPDAMQNHPDLVQAFFGVMEKVAQHFTPILYTLPDGVFHTLIQAAVGALTLQERFSLVYSCSFLSSLVSYTVKNSSLISQKDALAQNYGKVIIRGALTALAGSAPRSATQNIVDLLSVLSMRFPAETRSWVSEVLFDPNFFPSKAGPDAKQKFVQALNGPRSSKKLREAAHDFSLVARGLEGTSFGYATGQL